MKKMFSILTVLALVLSLCSCSEYFGLSDSDVIDSISKSDKNAFLGEWTITEIMVEPQYNYISNRNDSVNQLIEAFPDIDTTVEFTDEEYDDGLKMISSSNIASYSLMSDNRISVGDVVGTYKMKDDSVIITFTDIATITLER